MADYSDLQHLLYLIADDDPQVYNKVIDELINLGPAVLSELDSTYWDTENELIQERLDYAIQKIQFRVVYERFKTFLNQSSPCYLEFLEIVASIEHPDLDLKWISNKIEAVSTDVYLQLNLRLSPAHTMEVFNRVFYGLYNFKSVQQEDEPKLFFINHMLSNGKGHPDLMTLLYAIIAHKLDLSVQAISLPGTMILAYLRRGSNTNHPETNLPPVEFYINAGEEGKIFHKQDIRSYLDEVETIHDKSYFIPSSIKQVFIHYLASLRNVYLNNEQLAKASNIREMIVFLEG